DCGFLCLPAELDVDCEMMHRDRWKAVLPAGHPLAGRKVFPAEALARETFIRPEEGSDFEVAGILERLGIRPAEVYTVQGDETILAMVSAGLGVAVMPELMLENCAYPLAACSLEGDFTREIAVCVKDREAVSRSTRLFIEFTKAWVEQNV
ncbi:MAG: LysR family transcriptional regulator substrate-binding protein, partial [Firmicutes bacterium]|nr:LysR family transcriptional regulator substrate-binding protein [Bacillota bacterium]